MSYWAYYAGFFLLSQGLRQPWLLVGIVLLLLLRRFIPDPSAIWRALQFTSSLERQVAINPLNTTAQRDLAEIYLRVRRTSKALACLNRALERDVDNAELLLLKGMALHRLDRNEEALQPLVKSVEANARIRFGEAFRVAGDCLSALKRYEEAIDAYSRYIDINSSDVDVYTSLAVAHAGLGDASAMRKAIAEALDTWRTIPPGLRRKQLGAWLRASWARVWLLREPAAIGVTLVVVALIGFAGVKLGPSIAHVYRYAATTSEAASDENLFEDVGSYDGSP